MAMPRRAGLRRFWHDAGPSLLEKHTRRPADQGRDRALPRQGGIRRLFRRSSTVPRSSSALQSGVDGVDGHAPRGRSVRSGAIAELPSTRKEPGGRPPAQPAPVQAPGA